jgi:3-keto-disaccharide hydrolase
MSPRTRAALLVVALLAPAAAAAQQTTMSATPPNVLSSEEQAQGFRLLFDGTGTSGWRGYRSPTMPAGWQAVDGALTRVSRTTDIISVDEFENFELRLQWRIPPGGNSGIMYHVTEEGSDTYTSGPEMQVLDDARHPDGHSRLTSAGADYGLYPSPEGVVHAAGEWNDVRIIVNGAHVEHWLNGVKVVEYELWSDDWRARVQASKFAQWPEYGMAHRGHIALQGDHDGAVAYRSIRIRALP